MIMMAIVDAPTQNFFANHRVQALAKREWRAMHEGIHLSKRRQVVEQSDALGHFGGGYHSLRVCRSKIPTASWAFLALDLLGTYHCSHRDVGRAGYLHDDVWGVKTWYGRLGLWPGFGVIASGLVVFISLALLGPIGAMPPIMMLVLYESQPTATIVFALIYLLLHRQNRPDILLTQDNRPAPSVAINLGSGSQDR